MGLREKERKSLSRRTFIANETNPIRIPTQRRRKISNKRTIHQEKGDK